MIAVETEQLGGFVGEAVAVPLLSAGILLIVASYMLWTEPQVALVAFAFFIPSLLIAPWLQERINRYGKQRTELLRELSQGVVIDEGRGEDKRADGFKDLIGRIYAVRIRLYAVKFFAKFLNNFIGHVGVLAVLVFARMMVFEGRPDIGVVVAFISGFERIIGPARELLNFYRQQSQMRVQYGLIRDSLPTARWSGTAASRRQGFFQSRLRRSINGAGTRQAPLATSVDGSAPIWRLFHRCQWPGRRWWVRYRRLLRMGQRVTDLWRR